MAYASDVTVNEVGLPKGFIDVALSSPVPIVVADATLPDMPLVMVNDAFCKMTGRSQSEMLGRNCRFLQPQAGAGPAPARIRDFLSEKTAIEGNFILPNLRSDGTQFLNLLYLAKILQNDELRFVLGSQFDISTESIDQLKGHGTRLEQDMRKMDGELEAAGLSKLDPFPADKYIDAPRVLDTEYPLASPDL